jgi:inosine/xanthosine triphosphatase
MLTTPEFLIPHLIAVGSTNPAKVQGVARAVARVWPEATVRGIDVPSGVEAQPTTAEAGARGALQRAAAARAALDADLGIGIEGYTEDHPFGMFTTAWAAVVDRAGRVGLGSSGRCPLPAQVAAAIRAGGELGPLVDGLLGETNTKHRGGASGAFTAGLVERVESLSLGVTYALAPFLSPHFFGSAGFGTLPETLAALSEAAVTDRMEPGA